MEVQGRGCLRKEHPEEEASWVRGCPEEGAAVREEQLRGNGCLRGGLLWVRGLLTKGLLWGSRILTPEGYTEFSCCLSMSSDLLVWWGMETQLCAAYYSSQRRSFQRLLLRRSWDSWLSVGKNVRMSQLEQSWNLLRQSLIIVVVERGRENGS